MMAPFAVLSVWVWPGIIGIAFYGILVSGFAWMFGGTIEAIRVLAVFVVLTVIALLVAGSPILCALLVFGLGIAYGIAARYGYAMTILQIPIMIPYFLMHRHFCSIRTLRPSTFPTWRGRSSS